MLCKQHPLGKGGGICIYVKTCFDATIIEQKFNCLFDTFQHFEIELNTKFFNNTIIIAAMYKPQNTSIVNFNNEFQCYASMFRNCKFTVLVFVILM